MVEEPEFTDVIQNVTVPAGRSVRLACSVKNLGSFKVRTPDVVYIEFPTIFLKALIHGVISITLSTADNCKFIVSTYE